MVEGTQLQFQDSMVPPVLVRARVPREDLSDVRLFLGTWAEGSHCGEKAWTRVSLKGSVQVQALKPSNSLTLNRSFYHYIVFLFYTSVISFLLVFLLVYILGLSSSWSPTSSELAMGYILWSNSVINQLIKSVIGWLLPQTLCHHYLSIFCML